jgi:hypothetical protein
MFVVGKAMIDGTNIISVTIDVVIIVSLVGEYIGMAKNTFRSNKPNKLWSNVFILVLFSPIYKVRLPFFFFLKGLAILL